MYHTALNELFGKDCTFMLATCAEDLPTLRVVNTYFDGEVFWIVTNNTTQKVQQIMKNPNAVLCNNFHKFEGKAYNIGHPLLEENVRVREKLKIEFEAWYFSHNEEDARMCFVKFVPESGFFHKDGFGYCVDFTDGSVKQIPFSPKATMY